MLQELTIDNLAIIKHLTLTFADQMTVLTGETGAGRVLGACQAVTEGGADFL